MGRGLGGAHLLRTAAADSRSFLSASESVFSFFGVFFFFFVDALGPLAGAPSSTPAGETRFPSFTGQVSTGPAESNATKDETSLQEGCPYSLLFNSSAGPPVPLGPGLIMWCDPAPLKITESTCPLLCFRTRYVPVRRWVGALYFR